MPNPNATNPRTGKRYGWEAAQAQAKADAKANPAPDDAKHLALLKRQKKAIEARSHFLPFIEFTMPDPEAPDDVERSAYKAAKHHRASARVLEDVERGNIPMLIFVMPPRHGKSEQVSRRFPAWYSGRHPRQNVVVATYSDTFAATFGKEVRSIIRTPQFRQVFPTYRLQRGGEGSDFLMNTEGGQLVFVGRGGGLTGRGAHCFPAETRVETSRGSKRIADVLPGDEVLSYDEREGVVYRTVQAVARRPRSRLFRITTVAGRVVEATGDHPFYVAGRWVEAHALTVGDSLLCAVPKDVSSAERRGRQAHEEGPRRVRMFERVLGPQGEREKPRASVVPEMRATGAKEDVLWVTKRRSRLLFEGLHDCREAGRVRTASVDAIATLSAMQCNVHAVEREHSVLRTGVRFASSRRTDGERGQSALEGRDVGESREGARNASLSRDAAFGDAARRNAVHSVRARRNEKSFGGTSRRRECAEQSSGQSDYGVREVSQARAQFERTFDVVASVEETGREADVYDIQVGGTECFFADGVLVHNCLICDDLIKDAAEARSQAIRDEAWSWFTRVAMTRRMGLKLVILTFCLTGDSAVHMADGTTKPLREIVEGDYVKTWSDGRFGERKVIRSSLQGDDDILELRTNGSLVRGNAKHPFLVQTDGGVEWRKMGALKPGDLIVTSGFDAKPERTDLTEDEAWALGFFFGDGWVTINKKRNKDRNGQRYRNETQSWVSCIAACPAHPERVARAISTLEAKFEATFKATKFGYFRTEKAVLGRWLHEHGVGAGAKGKRVPRLIYQQGLAIRKAFLDGFSGADGSVRNVTGGQEHFNAKGGYEATTPRSVNRELIEDLRHLARSLGFPVTNVHRAVSHHKPPHSHEAKTWTSWSFNYHNRKRAEDAFTTSRVRSISPAGREFVYDLTVDGDENFIVDGLVVHNTRWHADDPIGRLTDPENPHYDAILAAKFKIILLPAIAEEDDPLGREPGDALWPDGPDRFDKEFLDEQRRLDPTGFQALYQGRPSALDGDLFQRENIQWYDPNQPDKLPELRYYCASDHAVGIKQQNDPSCFIRAGLSLNGDLYLTDCVWQRIKTDRAVDEMLRMGAKSGERNPLLWFAESGHISKSIGPFLYRQMAAENAFFNVREIVPSADKPTRAQSMIGRVAQKKVYFPKGVAWAERAVDEMMAFPNGLHDDFVDALSLFGLGLRSMFGASKTPDAKPKPATLTLDWVKQASRWKEERAAAKRIGGF